jgi:chromosome segregation ATPase
MPENKDYDAIAVELQSIDKAINSLDQQIADKSAAVRAQYEGIQAKQSEINSLKSKQQDIVHSAQNKAQELVFKSNASRRDLENNVQVEKRKLENATRAKNDAQNTVNNLKAQIKFTNEKIESLRRRWYDENAKVYTVKEGCLVCPVFGVSCGDPAALGKHEESQEKAKKAFFEAREKNLAKIDEEGESLSNTLESLTKQLESAEKALRDHVALIEECQVQVERLLDELYNTPVSTVSPVIAEELPEWQAIEKNIIEIKASIQEVKPVDVSELQHSKRELISKRDNLKAQLSDKDLIAKYNREISALEDESKNLSQQIADIEKQEFTIADFTKAKIDECDRRINGLFTMVKFQLFDRTIEGNEFEACIPTNNEGVPIASTNTAEKINAGLDIINALCRFHNVTAPIFIDGRESVNRLIETNSQIINLVVTTDKLLLIQ